MLPCVGNPAATLQVIQGDRRHRPQQAPPSMKHMHMHAGYVGRNVAG